jgi:hypothetical protein
VIEVTVDKLLFKDCPCIVRERSAKTDKNVNFFMVFKNEIFVNIYGLWFDFQIKKRYKSVWSTLYVFF